MSKVPVEVSTDDRVRLSASEQRFRAAEISGDTTAMQMEFDSKDAIQLRRDRDMNDAFEHERHMHARLAERNGGKKPTTLLQSWTSFINAQVVNLVREVLLYRKLTDRKIKNLEDRLALSEQSAKLCYRGVWKDGIKAQAGAFYTYQGALWACLIETDERPGRSKHFQLAVKSGRAS